MKNKGANGALIYINASKGSRAPFREVDHPFICRAPRLRRPPFVLVSLVPAAAPVSVLLEVLPLVVLPAAPPLVAPAAPLPASERGAVPLLCGAVLRAPVDPVVLLALPVPLAPRTRLPFTFHIEPFLTPTEPFEPALSPTVASTLLSRPFAVEKPIVNLAAPASATARVKAVS